MPHHGKTGVGWRGSFHQFSGLIAMLAIVRGLHAFRNCTKVHGCLQRDERRMTNITSIEMLATPITQARAADLTKSAIFVGVSRIGHHSGFLSWLPSRQSSDCSRFMLEYTFLQLDASLAGVCR